MVRKTYGRKRRCLGGIQSSLEDKENCPIESPPPSDGPILSSSPRSPDISSLRGTVEGQLLSPKSSPPPSKYEPLGDLSIDRPMNGRCRNQPAASAIRVRRPHLMPRIPSKCLSKDKAKKDLQSRLKSKRKAEPTLHQMTLSIGQTTQTTCRTCGMSYQVAVDIDIKAHKSFHSRAVSGCSWPSSKRESLIPVTKHSIPSSFLMKNTAGLDPLNDYIAEVSCSSAIAFKRATVFLTDLVDMELSAPSPAGLDNWSKHSHKSRVKDSKNITASNSKLDGYEYKAFVYVHCKNNYRTAVACLLVHPAEYGYFMHCQTGQLLELEKETDGSKSNNRFAISPAVMAVSRIYTTHAFRNHGIARLLLDIACDKFIFGVKISPSQVAWSQPSASGAALAQKWSGLNEIQVSGLLKNGDSIDHVDEGKCENPWLRVYSE